MSDRITSALKIGALCLGLFLFAAPAQATFIDTVATFTFIEPGFPDETKAGVTVADPAIELFAGDGSAIGGLLTNAGAGDANGEYIDIGMDFIEFRLFGGSGTAATAGGETTGWGAGAKYQIDFASNVLALFETPTLTLNDVFGVSLGTELMLTSASSLMLFIDTLGVDTTDNFGTVRLEFELKDITPNPIPVPAALPLMLSALALIGFFTRRRKPV